MNISKDQWAAIGRIVLVAIVALAAVFGYDLGVVQPREAQKAGYGSQATARFTSDVWLQNSGMKVDKTLAVVGVSTLSGGMVGAVTGDVTSTYLTSTNAISMTGATFTGPIKYGTAATYATGASIAHGFATTPTACLLWPAEITATLTITSTGFSSNSAAHSNPIYWLCGK